MGWNHRVLSHEHNGEVYLQIHDVYYNENGTPDGYTENPISVGSETIKGITYTLNKMLKRRTKHILWAGTKFPKECKITYICNLCGRDTFDKPSPHKCVSGFSKHGLTWSLKYE